MTQVQLPSVGAVSAQQGADTFVFGTLEVQAVANSALYLCLFQSVSHSTSQDPARKTDTTLGISNIANV